MSAPHLRPADPSSPAYAAGVERGAAAHAAGVAPNMAGDPGCDHAMTDHADTAASYRRGWAVGWVRADMAQPRRTVILAMDEEGVL